MDPNKFLEESVRQKASDIYVTEGKPIVLRTTGRLIEFGAVKLLPSDTMQIVKKVYEMADRDYNRLSKGDDDFSIGLRNVGRFRVNAYMQNKAHAMVIRTIPNEIPDPEKMAIPKGIMNLTDFKRGIVLFTGTTGSGKTTSLACLIDKINRDREFHILTIEDPIEFKHPHKKSVISQRELQRDTETYASALKAAMRQMPDVILVGEMRDQETMSAAITAAETGHLVFSTLHTIGAASTINRIIDSFPEGQQNQVRSQLAMSMQAVVSQQLPATTDGKRTLAYEIMICNPAIRNLIRENKIYQIESVMQTSYDQGNITMDQCLHELYKKNIISKETALQYSVDSKTFADRINPANSILGRANIRPLSG